MSRTLRGTVNLPGSKSESNRALMIAAYGGFPLEVDGLSDAHDTVLLKTLLGQVEASTSLRGASATKQSTCRRISNFRRTCGLLRSARNDVVDCEDAGTVVRFLLTYLANKPGNWLLTGTERLCQRPMAPLINALRQLGASVTSLRGASATKQPEGSSTEGRKSTLAQIVGHPIKGGAVTLDTSQSSQFASSLLMAAPTWERGLQLTLTGEPVSMPYLEMTLKMMEHFGVQVARTGNTITVPHQSYQPRQFAVSADWSAASYWYEMMALSDGGDLLLKGLKPHSLQGDAVVAEWFKAFGVITSFKPDGARLTKVPADPHDLVFDFTHAPDLYPAVCATCAALGVDAVFKGTATLSTKESDRLNALKAELSHLGENRVFRTYGDHRIAMALSALWPKFGPIQVDNPSVVNKSYPNFWNELVRY